MEEFAKRRAKLAAQMCKNSIALLFGAQTQYRNSDVEYPFRQNSNIYYLTGFCEPDVVMVLCKDTDGKLKYSLFNRASDPEAEVWNGKRAGQLGACKEYAADESFDIAKIDSLMPKLLEDKEAIYYPLGLNADRGG